MVVALKVMQPRAPRTPPTLSVPASSAAPVRASFQASRSAAAVVRIAAVPTPGAAQAVAAEALVPR